MGIILLIILGSGLWWLAVYLVSRNLRSNVAWITGVFLLSLSVYAMSDAATRNMTDYITTVVIWRYAGWSYLLPIALLFHFSVAVTSRAKLTINKILIVVFYLTAALYYFASIATNLVINYRYTLGFVQGIGFINPRGPLFWTISIFVFVASASSAWSYYSALKKKDLQSHERNKYALSLCSALVYAVVGPILVYGYSLPVSGHELIVEWTSYLLVFPMIGMIIAIVRYKLISDVDDVFNVREFVYLTSVIILICLGYVTIFAPISSLLGDMFFAFLALAMYLIVFTHGFYDWFTTWIRDLLYNAGKGFSLITDTDINDLVRNFHSPEIIETTSIVRFKYVKNHAQNNQLVDATQQMIREAIEFFKQPDYPRRTKQNIKYQILKMTALDSAEEGQILWELGFEGYPMKIMSGEDNTRKPLFKVESMSDYTAVGRNSFIFLKKEAIHDLAWRLSYLEKTAN